MFIPTYYKSHIINHIQSPQTHELTAIVSVQKIESNLIVATNVAQVITYLHTGHHTQCTKLITNISDMFNPTYYKSHIINQIQSLQTHELTAIVSVQKIESNHIVATNVAQVITYLHTNHHTQCTKVITNKSHMFNPTYYKSHIINQIQSPQTHELTAIVSVQKIESNLIVATNAAQVITYLHRGHHKQNVTDLIYLFTKLVLGFPKRMI